MSSVDQIRWAKEVISFGHAWRSIHAAPTDQHWKAGLAQLSTAWPSLRPRSIIATRARAQRPQAHSLAKAMGALNCAVKTIQVRGDAFNPWTVSGLRQDEVRIASVLAAFMTRRQVGDLAPQFLDAFLRQLSGMKAPLPDAVALSRGYRVRTEDCPLGLASERVDITIEGDGFLIGIEVKINAKEGPDQFARYCQTIERRAADGNRSAHVILLMRRRLQVPGTVAAEWRDVVAAARATATANRGNPLSRMLLAFGTHIDSF